VFFSMDIYLLQDGIASVNGLIFERAVSQTLTVEIDWVKTTRSTSEITVNPGPASVF
jgi:hypothetical protein